MDRFPVVCCTSTGIPENYNQEEQRISTGSPIALAIEAVVFKEACRID